MLNLVIFLLVWQENETIKNIATFSVRKPLLVFYLQKKSFMAALNSFYDIRKLTINVESLPGKNKKYLFGLLDFFHCVILKKLVFIYLY